MVRIEISSRIDRKILERFKENEIFIWSIIEEE